jgi:hypothetical protein
MDNRLPLVGMESVVSSLVEKQKFATPKDVYSTVTTLRITNITG